MRNRSTWPLTLLALTFWGLDVYVIATNLSISATYSGLTGNSTEGSLGLLLMLITSLTTAGCVFSFWQQQLVAQQYQKRLAQRQEKAEVVSESASAEVSALKAKVATLEKALDQALKSHPITTDV